MVEFTARVTGPIWLMIEGIQYHRMMRKRVRLGLADPLVANRFLLWAIAGGFSIVILSTSLPPIFLDPVEWALLLQFDLLLFGVGGVGAAAFYWLTFFPPGTYRRWICARASARS
jgi:hypothetical protein